MKRVSQAGHANIISSTPKLSDVGKLRCETTLMLFTPPAASEVKWQHKPFLRIRLSRSSVFGGSNVTSAICAVLRALAFDLGNQINAYWTLRSPRKTLQVRVLLHTVCASVTDTFFPGPLLHLFYILTRSVLDTCQVTTQQLPKRLLKFPSRGK